MEFTELRVHGVSGTPPREMLYTDPVRVDADADDYASVYRVPEDVEGYEPGVRAFHWGGLTAGSKRAAFWIFLAPFALANVAGWLIQRRSKRSVLFVRLAGMALTALFVSLLMTLVAAIQGWVLRKGLPDTPTLLVDLGLLLAGAALFFWIGGILSTQSHFTRLSRLCQLKLLLHPDPVWLQPPDKDCRPATEADWTDPTQERAGSSDNEPFCRDERLWRAHSILHRLRRIHLALGFAAYTVLVAGSSALPDWIMWTGAVVGVVSVLLLVATTTHPGERWLRRPTAIIAPLSVGITVVVVVGAALAGPGAVISVHDANLYISIAFGAFSFVALFLGAGKAIGALAVAAFFGSAMGIASISATEQWTLPDPTDPLYDMAKAQRAAVNGAAWVSVWMLVLIVVIVATASILTFIRVEDEPTSPIGKDRRAMRSGLVMIRRITHRVQYLLWSAAGVGVAAAIVLSIFLCDNGCSPSNLRVETWGPVPWMIGITVALLTVALYRVLEAKAVLVPLAAGLVYFVGRLGFLEFGVLGVDVDLTSLTEASLAIAVLLPSLFFLRSITAGIGDGEARRKTGLLWDVASFWPRWFHPLGPPAYGPHAVTRLTEVLNKAAGPVVLTAHSQGSMISAIALGQMEDRSKLKRVVTYGSPLALIYGHLFSHVGFKELLESKCGHDDLEWKNLWRRSDYLGGMPLGLPPDGGTANFEADDIGHSGYECTRQFSDVVAGRPVANPEPDDERACPGRAKP